MVYRVGDLPYYSVFASLPTLFKHHYGARCLQNVVFHEGVVSHKGFVILSLLRYISNISVAQESFFVVIDSV